MKNSFKKNLIFLIIFSLPIMNIVNLFNLKFNFSVSDVIVLIFGLAYICNCKNTNLKSDLKIFIYFFTLFSVIIVSNLIINKVSLEITVSEIAKILILSFYLFIGYITPKYNVEIKDFLNVWLLGAWLNILVGLFIQFNAFLGNIINVNTVISPRTRFMGLLTDANLAATYMTISFFLALIYYKISNDKKNKIFAMLTAVFCSVCIVLTQSRGGLIGFVFGFLLYFIYYFKSFNKKTIYIIPLLVILLIGFINFDHTVLDGALSKSLSDRMGSAVHGQGQFIIRKNLSLSSIKMGLDHPVFGVGRGNFINKSKPYIDKLYDKKDDHIYKESISSIPHNMFAGIFAELGIVGLTAFSSIFYILLKKWYKNDSRIKGIIFIMYISFFVQSLVLSLENFRGLWVLTGVFFVLADKKIEIYEEERITFSKKALAVYLGICLTITGLLYLDLGRKVQHEIRLSRNPYVALIENDSLQHLVLKYFIESESNGPDNISAVINIYGYKDGKESLIKTLDYWKAKGIGVIDLDENFRKYKVEFIGTENKNTKAVVTEIRYEDERGEVYPLNSYKYIPSSLAELLGKNKLLAFRGVKYNKRDVISGNNVDIAGKVEYINHSIEEINGIANIRFKFRALADLQNDLAINITATSDNINNSPYETGAYNSFSVYKLIEPRTSEWEAGKVYEFMLPFKGEKTEYDLVFNLTGKGEPNISKTKIYIGKVKTGSYKLADYLNNIKDNQLVIISIKDEGCRTIDRETLDALFGLGFSIDVRGKLRYSYIGVGGKIPGLEVYECLQWEKVSKKFKKGEKLGEFILPVDLELESAGYEEGNTSSIKIDGIEYSKNKRGMNIVVYDLNKGEVVDSVNFDTYVSIYR
jgi:hypothetical protein